jgi:hypothetical protein
VLPVRRSDTIVFANPGNVIPTGEFDELCPWDVLSDITTCAHVDEHGGLLPQGWISVSKSFPATGHEGPMSNKLLEVV